MLLDSHDLMKALIRLGPKAPAVLPGEDQGRGNSLSPPRSLHAHGRGVVVGTRETAKDSDGTDGHTANRNPARTQGFERRRSGTRTEETDASCQNPGRGDNNLGQSEDSRRGSGSGEPRGSDSSIGPAWRGYHIRKEEVCDASTRKLCSLPSEYFRLVANVARVPSGRTIVQSSGTLKRCLERLALDVSGSPAAQLATLCCRSEICVLIARMAGTYDRDTGAANDFILCRRYRAVPVLLGILANLGEHGRLLGGNTVELARHNAAYALAELCRDMLKAVPLMVETAGLSLACTVTKDPASPMPLLKQVSRCFGRAGSMVLLRRLRRSGQFDFPCVSSRGITLAHIDYSGLAKHLHCVNMPAPAAVHP